MELKAANIIIERDPMTKIPKQIPAWELELYEEKYPNKIEKISDSTIIVDELPDAKTEYTRLRELFGADKETNSPHVDTVFGRGIDGVERLQKAMHAARIRAPKPEKAKAADKSADKVENPAPGGTVAATAGAGAPAADAFDDPGA